MMATLPHVTYGSGLRKFHADGFLFDKVYTIGIGQPAHPSKTLLSSETFFLVLCLAW